MASLLFAVILLLLSLYVFGNFVKPAFSEIGQLRSELLVSENYLAAQKEAKTSFSNLLADYKNASSIQNLLALALPNKEGVADAVYQIQALSSINKVNILNISVEEGVAEALPSKSLIREVGKMKINARISGNYFAFKNFISGLENNIKLMDVKEMEVDGTKGSGEEMIYNLAIDTYYQK